MTSHAQDTLPAGTRLGRTALRVSDLDALTTFYTTVVGLTVLREAGGTATLGVDGSPLLVLAEDDEADARPRAAAGLYHNAFRVPTRGALGDALSRVQDRWQLDGASDHHVSEALYLTDPEDNGVEIYRDFPRGDWPRADDGRVLMDTDPLDLERLRADATGAERTPSGTVLGHVHLEVTSLAAFEEWYVDVLGFERQTTYPGALFVSAGGYHHHVGANTWQRRSTATDGRGMAWFEVVVPDADALDAVRSRLADHGSRVTEGDGEFTVCDPDGIQLRLRRETPGGEG